MLSYSAGKTKSWNKDMPGWNERLASDSEASVRHAPPARMTP